MPPTVTKKRKAQESTQKPSPSKKKAKRNPRKNNSRNIASNASYNSLAKDAPRVSGAIDGEKFMAARISEIKTLHAAIKTTSRNLGVEPFPSLLRGLRRRAASHNLYRPAARFREMASQKSVRLHGKQKSTRSWCQLKSKAVIKELFTRQHNKKWLETHLWHVKRMKMKNIWGYRLAATSMLKSARSIYRSFTRQCVVHDASYIGCMQLEGYYEDIVRLLNTMSDPHLPSVGSARYNRGDRVGYTRLYEYLSYPVKSICPASYVWNPKEIGNGRRMLWIWVHPSAYSETMFLIKHAIECKRPSLTADIQISDLRDDIVRFEVTGPQSTAVLQSILDPVEEADNEQKRFSRSHQLWRDLQHLTSTQALPPGVVIGMTVQDPRLKFPQKIMHAGDVVDSATDARIKEIIVSWPKDVSYAAIWEATCRANAYKTKTSEQALRKRREENLLPGSKLAFTSEDNCVPILLIRRGNASYDRDSISQPVLSSSASVEGWTVIAPRGWGLPFWRSLVFTGARVGGIEDYRDIHLQSGLDCFPYDVPGTRAFEDYKLKRKSEAEKAWLRKPSAKRLNYSKLGIEYPFEAAFDTLMQLETNSTANELWKARPSYSLLQGNVLVSLFMTSHTKEEAERLLQSKIETALSARGIQSSSLLRLDYTLVKVHIRYIDCGTPRTNAIIYLLEKQEDYELACRFLRRRVPGIKIEEQIAKSKLFEVPPLSHRIGCITNGEFSFSIGRGFGIGCCSAAGVKKLQEIDKSYQRRAKMLVLVRNTTDHGCRPAQLTVMQ